MCTEHLNARRCTPRTFLPRIIGTIAVLAFLGDSAFGEFVLQPIIMKKQVTAGQCGVSLEFKIENLSADSTEMVSLRVVGLARGADGIWTEAHPDDPNGQVDESAMPSCRDWLTCPVENVQPGPRQIVPVVATADIPADADGFYFAALIASTGIQEAATENAADGVLFRIQYLAPIILEVQPVVSDKSVASPRDVSGWVVDPNGRPVAGAQVALATAGRAGMQYTGVIIDPPMLRPITDSSGTTSEIVETDAKGRFSFLSVAGEFMVVVAHKTGFARMDGRDLRALMRLRLERWGRIEGTLYVGRKPATDEIARLDLAVSLPAYASEVRYGHETRVGREGRFIVPQVVPGELWIGHKVRASQDGSTAVFFSLTHRVHAKPGEILKIQMGGTGRPVIGKLVLPEDSNRPANLRWAIPGLRRVFAEPPQPVGYDSNAPSYTFAADRDGRFRIEDVVPGQYELTIVLENPAATGLDVMVGSYHATVEVPPMREAYMDKPLDLGEVELEESKIIERNIVPQGM